MLKKKVAIVCNGKELSYGSSLSHLFKYIGEAEELLSSASKMVDVELYSEKAFIRSPLPKSTIIIRCGEIFESGSSGKIIFKEYGMTVNRIGQSLFINANPKELFQNDYESFLVYANTKRNEYIKCEKDYFNNVLDKEKNWIPLEFIKLKNKGLWGNEKLLRKKKQQQFDCLAFVLYFIITSQESILEEEHGRQ